eukprot:6048201-Amphidinium_carterae.1
MEDDAVDRSHLSLSHPRSLWSQLSNIALTRVSGATAAAVSREIFASAVEALAWRVTFEHIHSIDGGHKWKLALTWQTIWISCFKKSTD